MLLGNFDYDKWIEVSDLLPLHYDVIREAQYEYQNKYRIEANAIRVEDHQVYQFQELTEFVPLSDPGLDLNGKPRREPLESLQCFGYWQGTGCFLFRKK